MTLAITHSTVATLPDEAGKEVNKTEWNDDHVVAGLGTGVETALGIAVGSAGAPVVLNGAGGTPSSLTLTNATGLPMDVNAQSVAYTVVAGDSGDIVQMTGNSAANLAVALTAVATLGDEFYFYLEHAGTGTSGANKKLVVTPAAGTIDGLATITLYPGDLRILIVDGSNWVTKLIRGGYIQVDFADSPFSFVVPSGWTQMRVQTWGAGGAGGGGEGRAVSIVRSGGGAGGGGKNNERWFSVGDAGLVDAGDTITATIGQGQTGAAGGSTGNGSNGAVGGNSTFGTLITGFGGGGGAGGGQSASVGGGGGGGGGLSAIGASATTSTGAAGGAALGVSGASAGNSGVAAAGGGGSTAAGANSSGSGYHGGGGGCGGGTTGTGFAGGSSSFSAAGGGSGGAIDSGNPGTNRAGGAGGNTGLTLTAATGGGGTAGASGGATPGGNGANGDSSMGGQGGGGGGSNNGGTGGAGGNGGVPGGGGAGGGGGTNVGGAGGNGGAGAIRIWYQP